MTLLDERIGALSHAVRHGLPTVENVALEVGESAASAGLSLREVFDRVAHLGDASHEETPRTDMAALSQTISLGWSDATEKFLLSMSCEDPVTGLATPAYLHVRLESLYRAAVRDDVAMSARHALVVVELPPNRSPLDLDLSMLEASEILRMVFTGDEVFARVHRRRIAVLVNRIDGDPLTVALISRLLARHPVAQPSRLWLEELPASVDQLPWTLGGLSSPPFDGMRCWWSVAMDAGRSLKSAVAGNGITTAPTGKNPERTHPSVAYPYRSSPMRERKGI